MLLLFVAFASDCVPSPIEPTPTEWRAPGDRKLFPVYGGQDGRIGFINSAGRVVVPPRYSMTGGSFHEGLMAVSGPPDAYLEESGREKFRATGTLAGPFSEGFAAVKMGDRFGYIDTAGKVRIEPQFQVAGEFHEGLAPVRTHGKHGYVDTKGRMAIDAKFLWADEFSDSAASVASCESCGYIDLTGKPLFDRRFRHCYRFSNGIAKVGLLNGKWGFVTKSGKLFGESDWAGGFLSQGLLAIRDKEKGVGFMNPQGEWVIEPKFASALPFSEGLAAVNHDGLWGFIDKTGKMVVAPRFGDPENVNAALFRNGLVFMADPKSGKYGFADHTGKWVIAPVYERCQEQDGYACGFHGALARVETRTHLKYIDRKGRAVWTRPVR